MSVRCDCYLRGWWQCVWHFGVLGLPDKGSLAWYKLLTPPAERSAEQERLPRPAG